MRPTRHDKYNWQLTADPPICAAGRPTVVLNACERRRRGGECWCRFDVADIAQDLREEADPAATRLAADLEDELEADEVEAIAEAFAAVIARSRPRTAAAEDRLERLKQVHARLQHVAEAGAGLTSRYTDDIDP
jgi:hypothetical protein